MKPLTPEEGKQLLFNTIRKDLKHQDYKRVCEIAKKYTAFVTGEAIKDLLIQFAPREDAVAFAQRVSLTKAITPYIANRIMAPMFKAGRTIASISYSWGNDAKSQDNLTRLKASLSAYYGNDTSVDNYLTYRMVELDCTDPNSFIVTELPGEYDASKPEQTGSNLRPYPFEVSAHEAINYSYENNILQFLIVLNTIGNLKRYTIYLENNAFVAQQITKDDFDTKKYPKDSQIFFKDPEKKSADDIYIIISAQHKAGRIPAVRIGSRRDLTTRGRTRVPLMHPAECFFDKSLTAISELDLTVALHVFPKIFMYDQVCPGDNTSHIICDNGKQPSGEKCPICKGSGFQEHRSSQDIIRVKMPQELKDVVPLDNFLAYKSPPIELIKFMKEYGIDDLCDLALRAVYTSEIYSPDTVTTTATEKSIDLESVYDALKLFTDKWSGVYTHIVSVIAAYLSMGTRFTVIHKFPKDFKMKTLDQLLADLKLASDSGAPSYIKKEIMRDLAQKMYIDKPEELTKIAVKERFFPFNGKTENEITTIITDGLATKRNQVLYANYDLIFDELEAENTKGDVTFWNLESTKQKELLNAKLDEFVKDIDDEKAASRATSFGAVPVGDGAAGPGDTQDYNIGDQVQYNGQDVKIATANPGPNGGKYTITLADNTTKDVSGSDLTALSNAA